MGYIAKNYRENADKTVIGGELAIISPGKLTKDGKEVGLSDPNSSTGNRLFYVGSDVKSGDAAPSGAVAGDYVLDSNGDFYSIASDGKVAPQVSLKANATPTVAGTVKQAAYVDDPAGDTPTKAEFITLRDALVAAGLMAAKS